VPQLADGPGQHLEPLLVLDAPPGDHQRFAFGRLLVGGGPAVHVDAVRHEVHLLGRELEPLHHLSHHEPRAGDDLTGLVREPPFDRVDLARQTRREVAAVAAAFGGVDGGHQRHAEQRLQRVARPGHQPVVRVHHLGSPVAERGGGLDELVVGRGHARDQVVVGQPRQRGVGAQHPHTVVGQVVVGHVGVVQAQHHHLVAGTRHRPCQPLHVGSDATHDERRVLPRQHQHAHTANVAARTSVDGVVWCA
jgi:hypothetical protein